MSIADHRIRAAVWRVTEGLWVVEVYVSVRRTPRTFAVIRANRDRDPGSAVETYKFGSWEDALNLADLAVRVQRLGAAMTADMVTTDEALEGLAALNRTPEPWEAP